MEDWAHFFNSSIHSGTQNAVTKVLSRFHPTTQEKLGYFRKIYPTEEVKETFNDTNQQHLFRDEKSYNQVTIWSY